MPIRERAGCICNTVRGRNGRAKDHATQVSIVNLPWQGPAGLYSAFLSRYRREALQETAARE